MTRRRSAALLLIAALVVVVGVSRPRAQTAPTIICGFAHLATPSAPMIISGTAYASQSVGNVTAVSVASIIPVLRLGSVVGALLDVEQNAIRFRVDGVAPTHYEGSPIPTGTTFQVCGSDLLNFSAVASSTGANAILRWRFYTQGG